MKVRLERLIWRRAHHRCEYCQMLQDYDDLPFQIDHIIARKHGGLTTAQNLALACFLCNNHRGQTSLDAILAPDGLSASFIHAAINGNNIFSGMAHAL